MLELYLIFGFLAASAIYLMIRTIFNESFLQEEWMHAQLRVYNSLSTVDYMEWDFQQMY